MKMKTLTKFEAGLLAAVLATGMTAFAGTAAPQSDAAIQQQVAQKLQKKSDLSGVRASVSDGVVTLEGTVKSFPEKLDAERAARKAGHIAGVRNLIEVSAPEVSDATLQEQAAKKLRYVGFGYGTQVFDAFQVGAYDGVVTVSGYAYNDFDKQQALDEVAHLQGVKGLVDKIQVVPVSAFDDGIRLHLLRSIYGGGSLAYGLDPQAPIRIVVDNGHVALYGFVTSQVDKTMAGMRAAQTFGVFGVQNHLQTPQDVAE
jgi:osmotically-inducible protein OsmY